MQDRVNRLDTEGGHILVAFVFLVGVGLLLARVDVGKIVVALASLWTSLRNTKGQGMPRHGPHVRTWLRSRPFVKTETFPHLSVMIALRETLDFRFFFAYDVRRGVFIRRRSPNQTSSVSCPRIHSILGQRAKNH